MAERELERRPMVESDADLRAFAECFERNDMPRSIDALRWQYFANPVRELLVELALADDEVAAIYAVQPAHVRVGSRRMFAAQSVDTLVDSRFRGRGLFTATARDVYARVTRHGGGFVYGFPNASSAPGFFGKLGWTSLDPVPFLIRPLRTSFLASKLPIARRLPWLPDLRVPLMPARAARGQQLVEHEVLGEEIDALWERFAESIPVAVERTSSYLRWRLAKPGERYRCLGLIERNSLIAFCAYTTVDKHGGRVGYVLELLHEPGRHRAGAVLLGESLRAMAGEGADVALAWCLPHSPNAPSFARAGFFPFPERLRPIELHFGVCPLDESLTPVLADRSNWYVSYCDSDTV